MALPALRLARLRPHAWLLYIAAGAVAIALYMAVLPEDLLGFWYDGFAPIGAAVIVLAVTRRRGGARVPHLLLALGMFLAGLGDLSWTLLEQAGLEPFPSFADAFYILGSCTWAAALWLRYGRTGGSDGSVLVEALILMTAIGLVVWRFAMAPVVQAADLDPLATGITLAYPLLDILLFGLIARLLLDPRRRNGAYWLVVVACIGILASDLLYMAQLMGDGYVSGPIDIGWLAGYVLFAASVLHPRADDALVLQGERTVASSPRLLLLAAASLLGPGLIVAVELASENESTVSLAVGAGLLSVLVIIRLAMALTGLRRSLDERFQLQAELEHQARHDALTGLANRVLFTTRLEEMLRDHESVPVLLVNLDDFKAVNDSYGHETGDLLLVETASRIRATLRRDDLAARVGADEFAVLLEAGTDRRDLPDIAERLLQAVRPAVELREYVVLPRASIGIAISESPNAEEVMRNADIALFLAKSQGKDRAQTFDARMHADVLARLRVRSDLQGALEANEFVVHYQPIVEVDSGRITATEALVRWNHRERGIVAPLEFIPVAESTGLIIPLGRWVLHEALATTRKWQLALDRPDLGISVNVSPRQFEHPGFAADVASALAASGVPPACLILEITESAILDIPSTAKMLHEIKRLGVRIAIDDFGTGYSSLSYVGRLPIDEVKVDRSFVAALGSDRKEAALAASVIQLGSTLDLVTVAEGIEDVGQLDALRALGCDLAQGYFIARPMVPERVEELLAAPPAARAARASRTPVAPTPVRRRGAAA